jgi:hypothetical protein
MVSLGLPAILHTCSAAPSCTTLLPPVARMGAGPRGQGFAVSAQARISTKMIEPVDEGLFATYREPSAPAAPPLVACDGAKAAFGKQARTTSIRGVWQQSDVQRSCIWRSASARPTCVLWSIVSLSSSVSLVNTVFRAAVGWWRVFAARGGGRRRG